MNLPCRFGRYTLLEKIANGGTAEVYRAVLLSEGGFEKPVAVKKLLPTWGDNEELKKMLVDEANVLCLLAHQAIVQVYELGSEEETPFIAMEFVNGIDCARLMTSIVRNQSPLSPQHALYIISQVLTALDFAHRCTDLNGQPLEIVHRDVSPSNIIFSWNGEVKVTDFGIAKGFHRTRETTTGQIRGKYAYMAPEQARGEKIDARADLFACGIVFYELLTGRRLFEADTDVELLQKVAGANMELVGIEPLPAEIRTIVMLSLSANPQTRYQSAAEMLLDVRRAARSVDDMSTSLEFAQFLRTEFPDSSAIKPAHVVRTENAAVRTLVMGPRICAEPLKFRWSAALTALSLAVIAVVPHASGSGIHVRGHSFLQNAAFVEEKNVSRPEAAAPPALRGAIAIDSIPKNARGILTIGEMREEIKTPFAKDDIEIKNGIDGQIEIFAAGFSTMTEKFHLEPNNPAFVKNFALKKEGSAMLSVNARPWGIASIAGVIPGRETPLNSIKVSPGSHAVKVVHPPSGRSLETQVAVAEGAAMRCFATFDEKPAISCR